MLCSTVLSPDGGAVPAPPPFSPHYSTWSSSKAKSIPNNHSSAFPEGNIGTAVPLQHHLPSLFFTWPCLNTSLDSLFLPFFDSFSLFFFFFLSFEAKRKAKCIPNNNKNKSNPPFLAPSPSQCCRGRLFCSPNPSICSIHPQFLEPSGSC